MTNHPEQSAYYLGREELLKNLEQAYQDAKDDKTRKQITQLKVMALMFPAEEALNEHVYCTNCEHFSVTEEEVSCPFANECYLWDTEDSAPRFIRWRYTPAAKPSTDQ